MSSNFPLIETRVSAPPGLTDTGMIKTLSKTSLDQLQQTMSVLAKRRSEQLRDDIRVTYVTRSSGKTAASVRATPARIVGNAVETSITAGTRAFQYITKWGGLGRVLPAMDIFPVEAKRLVFMGREGRRVAVQKVHHPGFEHKPDVVDINLQEYVAEVREEILQTVSRATLTWAEGVNASQSQSLRRQYRRPGGWGSIEVKF